MQNRKDGEDPKIKPYGEGLRVLEAPILQLLRGNFIMKGKNPLMFNLTKSSQCRV